MVHYTELGVGKLGFYAHQVSGSEAPDKPLYLLSPSVSKTKRTARSSLGSLPTLTFQDSMVEALSSSEATSLGHHYSQYRTQEKCSRPGKKLNNDQRDYISATSFSLLHG